MDNLSRSGTCVAVVRKPYGAGVYEGKPFEAGVNFIHYFLTEDGFMHDVKFKSAMVDIPEDIINQLPEIKVSYSTFKEGNIEKLIPKELIRL